MLDVDDDPTITIVCAEYGVGDSVHGKQRFVMLGCSACTLTPVSGEKPQEVEDLRKSNLVLCMSLIRWPNLQKARHTQRVGEFGLSP